MRTIVSFFVCCAIMGLGALAIMGVKQYRVNADPAQGDPAAAKTESATPAKSVAVQVLQAIDLEDRLLLTGSVYAWEDVWLSAEVAGNIKWQGIDEGQAVAKGQELIRIDTDTIRARIDQANAQHKLAVQEMARMDQLRKSGISSSQELDQVTAQRDVTSAEVRTLDIQVSKSVISAPFDAIIDKLPNEQNEFVNVGTELVHLVQIDRVKIIVGIPERDVPLFAKDAPVKITLDALPGQEFPGTIYRIATSATLDTRTFETEVAVDNPQGILKPGMIARARLVRHIYPGAIQVPIFAVIPVEKKYLTYIEENGTAQPRDVEVGLFQDNMVHITSGLKAGDRLIVKGQREVRPGEPVKVTEERAAS